MRDQVVRTIVTKQPPDFEIGDDGLACIRVYASDGITEIFCSPHVLLAGSSAAMRAIVEWQSKQTDPVRFRREPEE